MKQYASVSKSTKNRSDRTLSNKIKRAIGKSKGCTRSGICSEFSLTELKSAIQKLKARKSPGVDGITNEMIKNLSALGKEKLLIIYNKSWKTSEIPSIWRLGQIVPILKKKDPEDLGSYRPIALTSCVIKLFERMIKERLVWWLESNNKLNPNQAGFRRKTQMVSMTQQIFDPYYY